MHFRQALILITALALGVEGQALKCLAADLEKTDPAWKYLMQGTAELDAAHYKQGESFLNQAVSTDPKSVVALIQRGRCYNRLGKYALAASDFDKALSLHPGVKLAIQARKNKISALEGRKDWKQMIAAATDMIKLYPYEPMGYIARHNANEKLGEYALAKKDMQMIQLLAPRNPSFWQATNLIKSEGGGPGRFEAALGILNKHLQNHPYDGEAYFQRASINAHLGHTSQTMADYDACIKYAPDRFTLNADRARYLTQLKRYKEAISGYSDALQLSPGNDHLMLDRASCYMRLGDYQNSIKDYTALSALHPDDEDPVHYRARVYVLTKQYAKALTDYDRVIYMAPDQAANYTERSKVYEKLGRHELAVKDTEKAAALLNGPIH